MIVLLLDLDINVKRFKMKLFRVSTRALVITFQIPYIIDEHMCCLNTLT